MKFEHVPNLGEAIPRKSKLGLLIFGHAFFIGTSDRIGIQVVVFSWQHDPKTPSGWRRTWFKVVTYR